MIPFMASIGCKLYAYCQAATELIMPGEPRGEKRPADVVGAAVHASQGQMP